MSTYSSSPHNHPAASSTPYFADKLQGTALTANKTYNKHKSTKVNQHKNNNIKPCVNDLLPNVCRNN
jgi:hypothetical protein